MITKTEPPFLTFIRTAPTAGKSVTSRDDILWSDIRASLLNDRNAGFLGGSTRRCRGDVCTTGIRDIRHLEASDQTSRDDDGDDDGDDDSADVSGGGRMQENEARVVFRNKNARFGHVLSTGACTQNTSGPASLREFRTSKLSRAVSTGEAWGETLVMGKSKGATSRHKVKSSTGPAASIKVPQAILTKEQPKQTSLNQTTRSFPRPKIKMAASLLAATKVQRSSKYKDKVEYAEFLPVSGPEHHLSDLDLGERSRSFIKKKERRVTATTSLGGEVNGTRGLYSPTFVFSSRGSSGDTANNGFSPCDDDYEHNKNKKPDMPLSNRTPDLPILDLNNHQSRISRDGHSVAVQTSASVGMPGRGMRKSDVDYEEVQRRQQLAEQRRWKQRHLYNKIRCKPWILTGGKSDPSSERHVSFDNYDFLARYCILNQESLDQYRQTFDQIDEQRRGWLSHEETAIALREINNKLTDAEEAFLFHVIELTGYNVSEGADFRLFSTLAALSQRISSLDSWMKLMIREMNFQLLDMKMFLCKRLWEVCVDTDARCITIDQLIVELRSGGISRRHEEEVKNKLGHMVSLDLVDFLTYSPLFIMIHQAIVENPLSDCRSK